MIKEIIEPLYEQRVDDLRSGSFLLSAQERLVASWVNIRPGIRQQDSQVRLIAEKYIPSEVDESKVEREKLGAPTYDSRADQTEAMDIVFLSFALAISRGIELDPYRINPHINGYGKSSHIFDKMSEISGNMNEQNVANDIHYLLRHVVAYLASVPESFNPQTVMESVLEKNAANYPAIFFDGRHPFLPRALNPDELKLQYAHSRKCLKLIRYVHRELRNEKDRDYGLQEMDWLPYIDLIRDFTHADENYAKLHAIFLPDRKVA